MNASMTVAVSITVGSYKHFISIQLHRVQTNVSVQFSKKYEHFPQVQQVCTNPWVAR